MGWGGGGGGSKTAPCCYDPGIDFLFCSVFDVCSCCLLVA